MKNKKLLNILCFAVAAAIILAGYLVPSALLKRAEASAVGLRSTISLIAGKTGRQDEHASLSTPMPSATPEPAGMSGRYENERLIEAMKLLPVIDLMTVREPTYYEMSMSTAYETARNEINMLFSMLGVYCPGLILKNASLLELRVDGERSEPEGTIGLWSMTFFAVEGDAGDISVIMDALTGMIYRIEADLIPYAYPTNVFEMLRKYAGFLGIDTDGDLEFSAKGPKYTMMAGGAIVSFIDRSGKDGLSFMITLGKAQ